MQASFLLKKEKQRNQTLKITNYPTFGKPALTNATNQTLGKCHTWPQLSYNLIGGATKKDVIPGNANSIYGEK